MKSFFIFWVLLLALNLNQEDCVRGNTIPQQCECDFAFKSGPNFDYIKALTELKHAPNGVCPNGYMFIAVPVHNNLQQHSYEICGNPTPSHPETARPVTCSTKPPIICNCEHKTIATTTTTPKPSPNCPTVCYNCNHCKYKCHPTATTITTTPKPTTTIKTTTAKSCPNYPSLRFNCDYCNYKCQPTTSTKTTTTAKPLTTTTPKYCPNFDTINCGCDYCKCKLAPIPAPKPCQNYPLVSCNCNYCNYKCQPTTSTKTTTTVKPLTTTTPKPCPNYPKVHCGCVYCKCKPTPIVSPKPCQNYLTGFCNCDYCKCKRQPTTTLTTSNTPKPVKIHCGCDNCDCKSSPIITPKPCPNYPTVCCNCDYCNYKCQTTTTTITTTTSKPLTKPTTTTPKPFHYSGLHCGGDYCKCKQTAISTLKPCPNYPKICYSCNNKCRPTPLTTTTTLKPFTTTIITTPKLCPKYSNICCKCNFCNLKPITTTTHKPTTTTTTTTGKPSASKLCPCIYPFNSECAYCKCNPTKAPKLTPPPGKSTPKCSNNCSCIWCKPTTSGYKTTTTTTTPKPTACITPSTCLPCQTTTISTPPPVICSKYPLHSCTCNIPVSKKDCKCKSYSQNIDMKVIDLIIRFLEKGKKNDHSLDSN